MMKKFMFEFVYVFSAALPFALFAHIVLLNYQHPMEMKIFILSMTLVAISPIPFCLLSICTKKSDKNKNRLTQAKQNQ